MKYVQKARILILSTLVVMGLGGCGHHQVPIRVFEEPLPLKARTLSLHQIGEGIQYAVSPRGWVCVPVAPGLLACSLHSRGHGVDVDVAYSHDYYTIRLRRSHNMKDNGRVIHKAYNKWINTMIRDINTNF